MAQTPVTLNDLEGHFSQLTLLNSVLGNTTRIKLVYENREHTWRAALNELEGYSSVSGLFKCKSSKFCAALYKISTVTPASRGPSATARIRVFSLV